MCSSFDRETAHCAKYDMDVPEDFAAKEDACSDWTDKDGVSF